MSSTAVDPQLETSLQADGSVLAKLLPALRRLDGLLEGAVKAMQPVLGSGLGPSLQGLFVSREQVDRLLSQQPGQTQFQLVEDPAQAPDTGDAASPLRWLIESFALSGFDADVILLALAPELDLRYERIYSYLQDDVTRRRPTIDLALNLLSATAEDKLSCRVRFSPAAPLLRNRLIQIVHDSNQLEPSSLACFFRLDDQIRRLLLGQDGLDERLAPFCRLIQPSIAWDDLSLTAEIKQALPRLGQESIAASKPLRLYFQGSAEPEKRETAEGLADVLGLNLLMVRIDRLPETMNPDLIWSLVTREAQLHGAVLFISSLDDFHGADSSTRRRDLLDGVTTFAGITILAGRAAKEPRSIAPFGIVPVDFQVPDFEERCDRWQRELARLGSSAMERDVQMLAGRFRLTPIKITRAVATAQLSSEWRLAQGSAESNSGARPSSLSLDELSAAARSQCGTELDNLAPKIELHYSWEDLILPPDAKAQLREICSQAECRPIVYGKWGFDRKLSLGKGLNILFTGPPGTGKTMGAEVIARELCLDLYRIDLSQVVSKYIGETEKNLDRIFTAAEDSNAILFFDEADALFGKRSEVRDSHDRYANIEISYLLQKMEEYQGISVLATNLRQNIDEAFVRRLHAIVEFPFPDEEYRRRIWESVFPKEAPLGEDVGFDLLAHEVRLAGGNIKNMALAASFYAAADGGVVHMSHLVHAAFREHQKLARSWSPGDPLKAAAQASLSPTNSSS
jgi:Winged helix domain, variant/ATPase family associated with various cellular activities (AAA)